MTPEQKTQTYQTVAAEIASVIDGEPNRIARMATIACLLSQAFAYYFWTGFYLVDPDKPDELVIGPYQGTLGCLRIPFARGVCGACATQRETVIVPDTHAFPGHIACDSRSNSEIVVPVFDGDHNLIAVFDVDSTDYGSFDAVDAQGLEHILADAFTV
jgi:GAF domain-containing protein